MCVRVVGSTLVLAVLYLIFGMSPQSTLTILQGIRISVTLFLSGCVDCYSVCSKVVGFRLLILCIVFEGGVVCTGWLLWSPFDDGVPLMVMLMHYHFYVCLPASTSF